MSAAAGASQPPNQPPSGPANNPPATQSNHPGGGVPPDPSKWELNTKIKTCKCEACGERVKHWSYKCIVKCGRHICSECLDPSSTKSAYEKKQARDCVYNRCWCEHRSGLPPKFGRLKPLPPVRTEEERKARQIKSLAALNSASRQNVSTKRNVKVPRISVESPSPGPAGNETSDDSEGEYQGPQSGSTPIDKTTQRPVLKRKRQDSDNDDDVFTEAVDNVAKQPKRQSKTVMAIDRWRKNNAPAIDTPSHERAQSLPPKADDSSAPPSATSDLSNAAHLAGGSTVIIGAGFIGLFTARELALVARKANIEHHISVVDLRSEHCELASGQCNGLLTTKGLPGLCPSLANAARQCWEEIVSSAEVRQRIDFKTGAVFDVTDATGDSATSEARAPPWLQRSNEYSLLGDSDAFGRIDSARLTSWLYEQCNTLNVDFRFNYAVSGVESAEDSKLSSVYIRDIRNEDRPAEQLQCGNLILAAGPFTTEIFDCLFEKHHLQDLHNLVRAVHWFRIASENVTPADDIALRIPKAALSVPQLQNEITLVAQPEGKTIAVSGFGSAVRNINLGQDEALKPKKPKTSALRSISAEYLNKDGLDVMKKAHIQSKGRSEISEANDGAPIIDRVPVSGLGVAYKNETDDHYLCGVWLCYGFGRHGTMLAPGAARVLVEKMFTGSSGLEDGECRIPEYIEQKPMGTDKGKGRAK
ncbi:hypothetical protein LTR37_015710 [Vermiconidia calcicola]|uniref:Uncharacterized protein n=1 Tax=Vermiconidia calcicola TaxID=1690605 RepID=A0ACC3MRH7_9PEZI|nr:hypothetical protein LTR37_015710 [Vermiconidia calcicola]